jgi:hypothetical protein
MTAEFDGECSLSFNGNSVEILWANHGSADDVGKGQD